VHHACIIGPSCVHHRASCVSPTPHTPREGDTGVTPARLGVWRSTGHLIHPSSAAMCDRPHLRENREGVLRSADESKAEREAKRELAREMLRIGRLGYIAHALLSLPHRN
jgi:hypothetical protein